MTEADLDQFTIAYRHLGSALLPAGKSIDSDMLMDAFKDTAEFPLATVLEGMERLRRNSRFFPKPAQLIEACRELAAKASIDGAAIPGWVDHMAEKFVCDDCADTGFVRGFSCAGDGACRIPGCGRPERASTPHTYTRKCTCRATNPWLANERAKLRRGPEEPR